jgi:hypothetical protein
VHDGPDSDLDFDAMAVAFRLDDALDAEYLVLAERPDGSGRTLEVQRGLTESEDDVDLGMDTYCLVIDGGPTHYGGVQGWAASDGTLSLQLTADGTAALGAESIRVGLIPAGCQQAVVAALDHLLDGGPRPDDFTLVAAGP